MVPRLGCAFAIAAMALGAPLAPPSAGADGFPLSTPGSDDWRPLVFRGIANQTRYTLESFEGMEVAKAESNCGASGLVLRLDAIRLDQTPLLRGVCSKLALFITHRRVEKSFFLLCVKIELIILTETRENS